MAEEDARESPPQSSRADPAAWMALSAASREKADAFITEQTILTRLQAKEVEHELYLRHWQMRFSNFSAVMKATFEVALAFIFLAVAAGIAGAVWTAARDDSVVIESFAVPPDMANRGMTGQAVAAQIEDRLSAMQNGTDSGRAPSSYAQNWGDDFKLQIADTGISIGEVYRVLVAWLGHQTHVTGEVYRTRTGVAITARTSGVGGATVTGTEDDFDTLTERAAESIYSRTQPYRYAVYLSRRGRQQQAEEMLSHLAQESTDVRDRAWANIGLGTDEAANGNLYGAVAYMRRSIEIIPDFVIGWANIEEYEADLGHDEAAFEAERRALALFEAGNVADLRADVQPLLESSARGQVAFFRGDYAASAHEIMAVPPTRDFAGNNELSRLSLAESFARMHERNKALDLLRTFPSRNDPLIEANVEIEKSVADMVAEDWHAVIADGVSVDRAVAASGPAAGLDGNAVGVLRAREVWPITALAYAETGDFARADALIGRTAIDCYLCLRMRGNIDALEGKPEAALSWNARAIAAAPSLPLAYTERGAMLLAKGDADAAIAEFKQANKKGPHFADPLEMWGEALMQKHRSDLALAKFEEADKYAPRWARLHLKWGEALFYAGKPDEAKKQFAIAAGLDLSQSDKTVLTNWMSRHG
jgi:tetratricopeptide (TPR) repeat protein